MLLVTFKLISIHAGYYYYEIYPEGKTEDKGWIIFNPETKEVKEKHYPAMGKQYLNHAISGLTDKNGNYKKSGMVAWY
ncbi:MAG: hypothetical protein PUG99_03200 [Firmicutes bacterium]|nr:hypothetical protein [Peptoniphilus sp.]MDD7363145.1 hypothetical protein [Bacillota bacterium]